MLMPTTLDDLAVDAASCTRCHLYENATQTVFGEGPSAATVMLIGEQPGDKEDLAGHPFVGPAGRLLDQALDDAGIDRTKTYVTNVVKHFKWKPAGKVRLHQKPNAAEIKACKPWLLSELDVVQPEVVVLLGATAAQAVFGSSFRVTKQRGQFLPFEGRDALATVHPSSILRAPDEAARMEGLQGLVNDLRVVAERLATH
jgi:uracil-DNA glycosylase family protein